MTVLDEGKSVVNLPRHSRATLVAAARAGHRNADEWEAEARAKTKDEKPRVFHNFTSMIQRIEDGESRVSMDTYEHLHLSMAAAALERVVPYLEEVGLPHREPGLWKAIQGIRGELQYIGSISFDTPMREQIAGLLALRDELETDAEPG